MSAPSPVARIEQLEQIESDVIAILQNAGQVLQEIGKEKIGQKQVDVLTQQVMTHIKSVDTKLSDQIKYLTQVSTSLPHEGSSYPSQKVLQTAWHRLEHAKGKIADLDKLKQGTLSNAQKQAIVAKQQQQHHQQQQQQQQNQQQQQQQQIQHIHPQQQI